MFQFAPMDVVLSEAQGGFDDLSSGEWAMAYQHFAALVIDHDAPREILIDTSGVGFHSFEPFGGLRPDRQMRRCLALLFTGVGERWARGDFLRKLRIRKVADLLKPIAIHGKKPQYFPQETWFQQIGRMFMEPGPNSSHPKARMVQGSHLRFDNDKRWSFELSYGYPPRDSSSWRVGITQAAGESLDKFGTRIHDFIEQRLCGETGGITTRLCRMRDVDDIYRAVRRLFSFDFGMAEESENALTESIAAIVTGGIGNAHLQIDPRRLAVLQRWAKEDAKKGRAK